VKLTSFQYLNHPGFLAVAFLDGSICVVDMRVPRVILRHKESARKHRLLHRHSGAPDVITALNWTISPLASDAQPRIRLIAARVSGECEVFTVQNKLGLYTMEPEPTVLNTVERPLQDGVFVINSATGSPQRVNSSNLSASIQNRNLEDHLLLIVVGSKEAKCFGDLDDGHRLGKADWNAKHGVAQICQIVEKGGTYLFFSLP
jgi:syntaxin-binding protein 5